MICDIPMLCCLQAVSVVDVSHRLGHANPAITLELYAHALQQPGHVLAETFDRLLDDPWRPGDLINSRRRDEPTPAPNAEVKGRLG